jgi:hypothetical protein
MKMNNKITQEQLERLKVLNSKLYQSITGTSRTEIINNFEQFLESFEDFINFNEDCNFLIDKDNRKEFVKVLQLKFHDQPANQDQAVLDYLKHGNTISGVQALELFRCYRLSSVIHRLRNQYGYNIENISTKKFAIYKLIEN